MPERRLILVSNRLPYQLIEKSNKITLKQSDGGLVSALKGYFERQSSQQLFSDRYWVGSADFPEKRWSRFLENGQADEASFTIEPIFIEEKAYDKYYNGFCNATLWPLFHYFPSFAVLEDDFFNHYEQVNKIFAEKIASMRPSPSTSPAPAPSERCRRSWPAASARVRAWVRASRGRGSR